MNFVLFLPDWVVGVNNTHRLVIPGCDVELCDFELSPCCAGDGAGGIISSYLTSSQLYQPPRLGCVIGVRERYWVVNWIVCSWIFGKVGRV